MGLIPWFDGMLKANEEYFAKEEKLTGKGKPLFQKPNKRSPTSMRPDATSSVSERIRTAR